MKAIVIYNSKTGFTKKYAQWISEETGCECIEFKKASKINLFDYDAIVFGSWCMAGTIMKLGWFKKRIPSLSSAGKKLIVYAVGATPNASSDIEEAMNKAFPVEERSTAKVYYCQGGLDYSKMGWLSSFAMRSLAKSLRSKKNASEDDLKKAEIISNSFDVADKKFAEPIIAELKQ